MPGSLHTRTGYGEWSHTADLGCQGLRLAAGQPQLGLKSAAMTTDNTFEEFSSTQNGPPKLADSRDPGRAGPVLIRGGRASDRCGIEGVSPKP